MTKLANQVTGHFFAQLFALSCFWVFVVAAAVPFADSALQVEAKETFLGGSKRIVITFRDPSYKAGPISAHVYFIGKAPHEGARFIYAHSDISVNLRGMSEASAKVDVPALQSGPTRRAPKGYALIGIGDMEGWIIIGQVNGKGLSPRASSPALMSVAQGKSTDSLNEMISDYNARSAAPARR